jgi:hypothetical protein
MLAALALAAAFSGAAQTTTACTAWHPAATGFYPGVVESTGPKNIDTWIDETPDGRLAGHYVLHEETRDVQGTLDPVGDEDCDIAIFRWSDIYGSGLTRLTFDTTHHCFDGAWGRLTINPTLVWHACIRERVTS